MWSKPSLVESTKRLVAIQPRKICCCSNRKVLSTLIKSKMKMRSNITMWSNEIFPFDCISSWSPKAQRKILTGRRTVLQTGGNAKGDLFDRKSLCTARALVVSYGKVESAFATLHGSLSFANEHRQVVYAGTGVLRLYRHSSILIIIMLTIFTPKKNSFLYFTLPTSLSSLRREWKH